MIMMIIVILNLATYLEEEEHRIFLYSLNCIVLSLSLFNSLMKLK